MLFCKPLKNKSRYKPFRKIDEDFVFTEYEKASQVPLEDWGIVVKQKDYFFNLEYLKLIEFSGNVDLKCRYLIVYKHNVPCAIFYFQITDFKANVFGALLQDEIDSIQSSRMKLFEKYVETKDEKDILFRLLTCGNNLISGEYGFLKTDKISNQEYYGLLCTLIKIVSIEENLRGKISATVIKDFLKPIPEISKSDVFNGKAITLEPNMIVTIPEEVKSLEDYLQLFSKKYRNRAKTILKFREQLVVKFLDENEIEEHNHLLFELYSNLYNRAKFKLLQLPINYFLETKRIFKDLFFVRGIYYNNTLVAFTSGFLVTDKKVVEAHYIGINYELNENLELYQNILYDFIEQAILNNYNKVNLGRTAAEIKTTVGAKAEELFCYVQPQNTISKLIVKPFVAFLQPKEWTPRNPFKEQTI